MSTGNLATAVVYGKVWRIHICATAKKYCGIKTWVKIKMAHEHKSTPRKGESKQRDTLRSLSTEISRRHAPPLSSLLD